MPPYLSIGRSACVVVRKVSLQPNSSEKRDCECTFGFQVRLFLLIEKLTLLPDCITFPPYRPRSARFGLEPPLGFPFKSPVWPARLGTDTRQWRNMLGDNISRGASIADPPRAKTRDTSGAYAMRIRLLSGSVLVCAARTAGEHAPRSAEARHQQKG